MASSASDAGDYASDFEEASEDELGMRKSLHGEALQAARKAPGSASRRRRQEAEAPVPAEPQADRLSSPAVPSSPVVPSGDLELPVGTGTPRLQASPRPSSKDGGRRPGRRRPDDDARPPAPAPARSNTDEAIEMNASNGSFASNSGGRRPVRAKISVGGNENEPPERRPGTGDSSSKASATRQNASVPLWLQHDENAHRNLPRHLSPNRGGELGTRTRSGDRLAPNSAGSGGLPPRAGYDLQRSEDSVGGRGGRSRPPMDPDFDADSRLGTADGGDRKIKRLQQEIQRLTARLKEAELYSAQDEGLPLFTLEEVEVGCQIAQGGFSSVHHANWRSTPCALKKIFDPVITDELRAEFENEVRMLRRLRHPNVITLMAVCRQPPALSILTEFVGGGSLFELLHGPPQAKRPDSLDCEPAKLMPVMQQTSAALAYLHAMLVVHRDVKSHNVLMTPGKCPVAKLCDFGLARPKSELCTGTMQWAGTASYMAPELFAKRKYTEAVDVFAFGVMLWETVSTEIPHANLEACDIAHRVQMKDGAGLPVTHGWPKSLKALLRSSMAVQSEDRPTMVEVSEQLQQIALDLPAPDDL